MSKSYWAESLNFFKVFDGDDSFNSGALVVGGLIRVLLFSVECCALKVVIGILNETTRASIVATRNGAIN